MCPALCTGATTVCSALLCCGFSDSPSRNTGLVTGKAVTPVYIECLSLNLCVVEWRVSSLTSDTQHSERFLPHPSSLNIGGDVGVG